MARLDADRTQHEIFDLDSSYMQEVRAMLLPVVDQIVAARTPRDFMRAQIDLRDLLAGRQDAVAEIDRKLQADKQELKGLIARRPKPLDDIADLQDRIDRRAQRLIREEALRHVHRCIADGLAWRAVGYDRAVFSILGQGPRVGRFSDEGLQAEFERAQELWDGDTLPLLNDMTNALRTGDITVLHTKWPAPVVGVDEVKRSGRDRKGRQTKLREERQQLLADGWLAATADHGEAAVWESPVRFEHHLPALAELISRARVDGYAECRIDEVMMIAAVDVARMVRDGVNWFERSLESAGWDDQLTYQASAIATRMNERREAGPASLAPVGAFPLSADDIVDLLLGELDYVVTINLGELKTIFNKASIKIEFSSDPSLFLNAKRGSSTIAVPAVLRDQMLRETMRASTLVSLVSSLLDGIDAGAPSIDWIVVMDERESWEPPK